MEPNLTSLEELNEYLLHHGCNRCDLGSQKNINGCCVSRGDMSSRLMIVGESPAEQEDRKRKPLVGPAGQLLDRIWKSIGLDTNDWYLTNTVLCRSVAPYGSGRKNLPPTTEQKKACSPYLWRQIQLLNPEIIVTLGVHATASLLNKTTVKIGEYRGKLTRSGRFLIYPMLHPSCLLQTQRDEQRNKQYKQQMWTDIKNLRETLKEKELI